MLLGSYCFEEARLRQATLAVASWVLLLITLSIPMTTGHGHAEGSVLDLKIQSLKVQDATMKDALLALRAKDPSRLLIGFENVPHAEDAPHRRISVSLQSATVREILNHLCQADPRYEFAATNQYLINVRPRGRPSDPHNLMDMKVREFAFHGAIFPHPLIEKFDRHVPELREFLEKKRREWAAQVQSQLGSPGSLLTGNAPPPEIDIELRDVTVREVLNAIALHSRKLYDEGQLRGLEPVGWEYEFIVVPDAPTGLGGYPRWRAL